MTTSRWTLADTDHRLTRRGRELRMRVAELSHPRDGGYLLVVGEPTDDCLVRIHSRCLYGDALRAEDCDCGPELDLAMDMIQDAGAGVLVYLEQEGRGAGLVAKARGLRHSEIHEVDTFASYDGLGLARDARSYDEAARALLGLGLCRVRLLTNNPDKAASLRAHGIGVVVEPLLTRPRSARARRYLQAKRAGGRHWLPDDSAGPWARGSMSPETTLPMPVVPSDAAWSEEFGDQGFPSR